MSIKASSFSCSENLWYGYPIHIGNKIILCNPSADPPTWSLPSYHCICPTDSPVVYAAENFLDVTICFLFVNGRGNNTASLLSGKEWRVYE
jgi:hypothetical protein